MSETMRDATHSPKLVTVTEGAVAQLKNLREKEGKTGLGVRLGVKGGGCSGFSYVLDFDEMRPGDHVIEEKGLFFYLDKKSAVYLRSVVLDHQGGLQGRGFVFQNPNASGTCGCGESFSV